MQAAGDDADARNAALVDLLREALEQVERLQGQAGNAPRATTTSGTPKERTPLSRLRGLEHVGVFDGRVENFLPWKERLESFLADEPGLSSLLLWAERQTGPIHSDDLDLYEGDGDLILHASVYSQQMHTLLMQKTQGTPFNQTRNTKGNGLEAWRKIVRLNDLMTPQVRRRLLQQVIQPKPSRNYAEVADAEEAWERSRARYEESAPTKLPEDVLVTAYMSLLPQKLKDDMEALDRDFSTLPEAKAYVLKQVNAKRDSPKEPWMAGAIYEDVKEEAGEEDDVVHQILKITGLEGNSENAAYIASMVQKGKGKGKSGGKGGKSGFGKGVCWHCGSPDHTRSQCPQFDEVMRQRRAEKGVGKGPGPSWGKGKAGGKGAGAGGKGGAQPRSFLGVWQDALIDSISPAGQVAGNNSWCGHVSSKFQLPVFNRFDAFDTEEPEDPEDPDEWPEMTCNHVGCKKVAKQINVPRNRGKESKKVIFNTGDFGQLAKILDEKRVEKMKCEPCGVNAFGFAPTPAPQSSPIMAVNQQTWKEDHGDWVKVTSLVDSGCVEAVSPPEINPAVPIQESPGSRAGQQYAMANDETTPNLGEKVISFTTTTGELATKKYQIADVSRPIDSVGEICDSGCRVVFGSGGGFIYHLATGRVEPFHRMGRLYGLDLWMPKADFVRQG